MKKKLFIVVFFLTGLTACSTFFTQRSYERDSDESVQAYYRAQRTAAWNSARQDLGYLNSRELSDGQAEAVRNRVELTTLEKNISNSADRKQYYALKPYFRSDRERIHFLRIPNREGRERWAAQRGIAAQESQFDTFTTALIEKNDVAQGMTRKAVQQSWGEPEIVEVAGDPLYGNERWRYSKLVPTEDGYKQEVRVIYFESGRVVGWETM